VSLFQNDLCHFCEHTHSSIKEFHPIDKLSNVKKSYPVNILISKIPQARLVGEDKRACLLNIPLITLFKYASFKLFKYEWLLFFGLHLSILSGFIIYLAFDCLLSIH
jgi:hypothetical protein